LVSMVYGMVYGQAQGKVLTPSGYIECATEVPHGSHVLHDDINGGFIVTDRQTGALIRTIAPCGASRTHRVLTATTAADVDPASSGFRGGWQVYAKMNVTDLKQFTGQWTVPNAPEKYTGQTVFLFTGLQNEDWVPPDDGPKGKFDIIQPVLQYGPSSAGGGKYWMISSWYVPLGGFWDESVFSTPKIVHEGDVIFGNMTRTVSNTPTSWTIDTYVVGNASSHTSITVNKPRLSTQPFAYVTFESYADYDELNCSMWPTKVATFSNLAMEGDLEEGMNWSLVQKDTICGASAASQSADEIVISF